VILAMYLLLADETNQQPSRNAKFYVYGGVFFPIDSLVELHVQIDKIRCVAGYGPADKFKFDTRSRPSHVSFEASTAAKRKTLDICKSLKCKFIVQVILHDIIKNQGIEQQSYWAADYVFGRFNTFLKVEAKDFGICVIDNLPTKNQYKYLSKKFATGLTLHTGTTVSLSNIKLFGTSCIGASHACSAMDIVLGSFRYCINNPENEDAAKNMMGKVMDLLWHTRENQKIKVLEKGLIVRPKITQIRSLEHKQKYQELFDHINYLIEDY